jgi:hypothetical protein
MADSAGVHTPPGKIPFGEKKAVLDEAVGWLRHNDPPTKVLEDPRIVEALANLSDVAVPRGCPKRLKKAAGEGLEWLRSNEPNIHVVGDPSLKCLANLSIPQDIPEKDKANILRTQLSGFERTNPIRRVLMRVYSNL